MEQKKNRLYNSFKFAFRGFIHVVKHEYNFRLEFACVCFISVIGFLLGFTTSEWLIVLIFIALVLSAEIFNSVIENICNLLNEELKLTYARTKEIRDASAAAVLTVALGAALSAIIIVLKHL